MSRAAGVRQHLGSATEVMEAAGMQAQGMVHVRSQTYQLACNWKVRCCAVNGALLARAQTYQQGGTHKARCHLAGGQHGVLHLDGCPALVSGTC